MPRFKAKPIETDEQLLHTTRYVHLNPLTSGITKSIEALAEYPYSSYPQYSGERDAMWSVNKDVILDFYKNSQNPQGEYLKFVKDQVGYQRELHKIKHLLFE